jgi:hypothetical protein
MSELLTAAILLCALLGSAALVEIWYWLLDRRDHESPSEAGFWGHR